MISVDFISGCMLGVEFGYDEEDELVLIVDIFFLRFLIGWK